MITSVQLETKLSDCFLHMAIRLREVGRRRETALHIQSEAFFLYLLNLHLSTQYELVPPGMPGIDLYEPHTGHAFQISTENSKGKIHGTLKQVVNLREHPEYGKKYQVKKLSFLFLTYGNGCETASPEKLGDLPFDFTNDYVYDLVRLKSEILHEHINEPARIESICDYLNSNFEPFYQRLRFRLFSKNTVFGASCYAPGDPMSTIFAGNLWGLHRGAFTGIYIDRSGEDKLLEELWNAESWLAEVNPALGAQLPGRTWYAVDLLEEGTPKQLLLKRLPAVPGKDQVAGFYVNLHPAPGSYFEEEWAHIAAWCVAAVEFRQKRPGVALILNIRWTYSELSARSITELRSFLRRNGCADCVEVLFSAPEKIIPTAKPLTERLTAFSKDRAKLDPALDALFGYLFDLLIKSGKEDGIFSEHLTIAGLIMDHIDQYHGLADHYEAGRPVQANTLWDFCAFHPAVRGKAYQLVTELLQLSLDTVGKPQVFVLLEQAVRHESQAVASAALGFALGTGKEDLLDTCVQVMAASGRNTRLPSGRVHREAMMIALLRCQYNDRQPFLARANADTLLDALAQNIRPSHFVQELLSFHRTDEPSPDRLNGVIRRMSPLEALCFLRSGLYRKFPASISLLLDKIGHDPFSGVFWKTLIFSQPVGGQLLHFLARVPDIKIRSVAGLCTGEEMATAEYRNLIPEIEQYRTFPLSTHG